MDSLSLAMWLLICFGVAALGGSAPPDAWYRGIRKPTWNPPDRVFAPVWSVLFVLMAVAVWLVWLRREAPGARLAIILFSVQLGLNALWSWLFFRWHRPDLAFLEVLLLWAAILATTLAFYRVRPLAAWLLLPYLAWVAFAACLNWVLWRLNAATLGRPPAT